MSTRQDTAPSQPVHSRDDLVAWIAEGSKPPERWRIGTEHEKFLFPRDTLKPVPYEGERGVRALMQSLIDRYGWQPIREGDTIIALKRPEGEPGGTVSLEPGGQFELSGEPLENVHQVASETQAHLDQCLQVGTPLGIGFLGLGFAPEWTLGEMPRMPKQRYGVMTALHAQGRHPRPRHDVPHLHHPGEPRLRQRGRHGAEIPRGPRPAADRHRHLRLLALHRGQAQRLPLAPQRDLAPHRRQPHRHAAVRVRARHGLRALCRLCARCADVLRLPRRPLHRRFRRLVPRLHGRPPPRSCPASGRRSTIGPTT